MSERESTGVVVVDPLGGLQLDPPNELRFKGPFDDYVTVSLTIKNPTAKRIAFKIKTTAPKRYCVKPNSGVLDPQQLMKVNVLLQPFNYDPNEKSKHKFMVQYLYLNDDEINMSVTDILNMWKDIQATRLLDLKLKCIFEFTENEQQKLAQQLNEQQQQQQPSTNSTSPTLQQKITSQNVASNPHQSSSTRQTTVSQNSGDFYSTADSNLNDFDSTNTTKSNLSKTQLNNNNSVNNNNNNNNNSNQTNVSSLRKDNNDNILNELQLVKNENDELKKQVKHLKEEEARLRKLALSSGHQSPSGTTSLNDHAGSLADLLNERSFYVIVVLIAIIIYLLLFR